MIIPESLLETDRDLIFTDWAEPITWRQLTATYTPETQTVSEILTDTTLQAIASGIVQHPGADTAGQYLTGDQTFLIKAADIPGGVPTTTSRLIHHGTEYDVLSWGLSTAGVYVIRTRKHE